MECAGDLQAAHNIKDDAFCQPALLDLRQDAGPQVQSYLHEVCPGSWSPADAQHEPLHALNLTQIMTGEVPAGLGQNASTIVHASAHGNVAL